MLTIQDIQDFKIERRRIQLPKPEKNKGNLIFLPYLSPEEGVKAIKNTNRIFNRSSYWKMFFRDYKYQFKLFNKNIRYNNLRERNEILDLVGKTDSSLKPVKNFMLTKGKNCYIDISYYLQNFFSFRRSQYKIILTQFFNMLNSVINKEEYAEFNNKFLIIDINEWEIANIKNIYQKNNILNNPLSIIYLAMRKNIEEVKSLGNCEIVVTDGTLFFKFNPSRLDKDAYMDFKLTLTKIKPSILSSDLDNDNHLDTYGAISSNASTTELDKAKAENKPITKDENVDSIINNDDSEKSLLDRLNDLKSSSKLSDDDDEEEEDESEDLTGEEPQEEEPKHEEPEKDEDEELEDEIEHELSDEEVAQQVQDYLNNKVPNTNVSRSIKSTKEISDWHSLFSCQLQ